MATESVPAKVLAAIKSRKFSTLGKLFAPKCDFQAWTPSGRWVAEDPSTVAKIVEVWFTPGAGSTTVTFSTENASAKAATLEYEVSWKIPTDDLPRVLRDVWIMNLKDGKITSARVYSAGLHIEFPDVDLEKQRRQKGLAGPKMSNSPKVITSKAS
jgi:ketosteroid isomerase-like protein